MGGKKKKRKERTRNPQWKESSDGEHFRASLRKSVEVTIFSWTMPIRISAVWRRSWMDQKKRNGNKS